MSMENKENEQLREEFRKLQTAHCSAKIYTCSAEVVIDGERFLEGQPVALTKAKYEANKKAFAPQKRKNKKLKPELEVK